MNIKEMEERSGLVRANIRYYEKEGLLCPVRRDNGYRDYSEEDLMLLKRIRLLRELGISLEQVRGLIGNPEALEEVMEQRVQSIEGEVLELNDAAAVCSEIRYDGVTFDGMDADRYLNRLEALAKERDRAADGLPGKMAAETDREPFTPHPWRRFLARMLDFQLYGWLVTLVWNGLLNQPFITGLLYDLLKAAAALGIMFLAESLFLSFSGTTPGKWIFGISVCNQDGKKLTFSQGMRRTGKVLVWGMGLQLPLVDLYRKYRSYKTYVDGQELFWDRAWDDMGQDEHFEVCCEEQAVWKMVTACIMILGVILGSSELLLARQQLPPNRGELTVKEFSENYNYYADIMCRAAGELPPESSLLDGSGQYRSDTEHTVVVQILDYETPRWEYRTQNGILTEASFEIQVRTEEPVSNYKEPMMYGILALGGAWEGASVWNRSMDGLLERVEKIGYGDYSFTSCGVRVTCRMEYDGEKIPEYEKDALLLWDDDGQPHDFHIRFVMETAE